MNVVDGKTYFLDISVIILVCIIIIIIIIIITKLVFIILSDTIRPDLTKNISYIMK